MLKPSVVSSYENLQIDTLKSIGDLPKSLIYFFNLFIYFFCFHSDNTYLTVYVGSNQYKEFPDFLLITKDEIIGKIKNLITSEDETGFSMAMLNNNGMIHLFNNLIIFVSGLKPQPSDCMIFLQNHNH